MIIENLKRGNKVICPEDRGGVTYIGEIVSFSDSVNYTQAGVPYVWVEVLHNGNKHMWSSNRLKANL